MKIITIDREKCLEHLRCWRCEQILHGLLPHIFCMGSAVIQDWAWQENRGKIEELANGCPANAIEVQE